jgi:hypothetical protein
MNPLAKDRTGQRYGRLVAISCETQSMPRSRPYWTCRCDCGTETSVRSDALNRVESCGCLAAELSRKRERTHGQAIHGKRTPEWKAWQNAKERCRTPSHRQYGLYGARGIQVCEKWSASFEAFFADMGKRPSKTHSLDRIDVNGNYEPGNCRWATPKQQANNRRTNVRLLWNGAEMTLAEIARLEKIPYVQFCHRINNGFTINGAVKRQREIDAT